MGRVGYSYDSVCIWVLQLKDAICITDGQSPNLKQSFLGRGNLVSSSFMLGMLLQWREINTAFQISCEILSLLENFCPERRDTWEIKSWFFSYTSYFIVSSSLRPEGTIRSSSLTSCISQATKFHLATLHWTPKLVLDETISVFRRQNCCVPSAEDRRDWGSTNAWGPCHGRELIRSDILRLS